MTRLALLTTTLLLSLAAATAAGAKAPVGFFGCRTFTAKHPVAVVRPRSIMLACGDGNAYLTGLTWKSWGAASASGAGTLHQNDCTPYCAAGHFHASAAAVSLSRPVSCRGRRVFTRVTWVTHGKHEFDDYACTR